MGTDWLVLLRLGATAAVLWILPWWPLGGAIAGHGAARISMAFLLGIIANVLSSYVLIVLGAYGPVTGLVIHLGVSAVAAVATRRWWRGTPSVAWPVAAAMAGAVALRLPDAVGHLSLGGNDPWGHLFLCKALAKGDPLAGFHFFSYYPRGYHALVLTLHAASGVTVYDIMRLFGPLVSVMGVIGAAALASRAGTRFGGMVAACAYAVPAYRHLVLPSLETTLEPDRLAFAFIPAVLLLVTKLLESPSTGTAVLLLVAEVAHVLVHPLSVQFTVGWIVCGAVVAAWSGRKQAAVHMATAAVVTLVFAGAYFHVMRTSYGISVMTHLSPRAAFAVGGFGVDLRRVIVGTGWRVEAMDGLAVGMAAFLVWRAIRRREPRLMLLATVLLHATYAATRDALYFGDFGHAPPYYAMAWAWATGGVAGEVPLRWRPMVPMAVMALLLGHGLVGGVTPLQGVILAMAGLSAAGALVTRAEALVALFVGLALFSLRPHPVRYARLGYPETVRWALALAKEAPGTVYSLGLLSSMPDGMPFPTQDPVPAIVWPRHRPRPLSSLVTQPTDRWWPPDEPVYVMAETLPYQWSFPYFAAETRATLMARATRWLAERADCGAPVKTLASTGRMVLVALHDTERE